MAESSGASPRSPRLTSRQAALIRVLLQTGAEPVTVGEVAKQLDVSSRTVLRELREVEKWFRGNGVRFVRKPSVGLSVQEDERTLQLLRQLLDSEQVQVNSSRQERRRQLLGELLLAKEPIKSYVFLNRFQISEGTLSADLDALEEWLSTYDIRVIRRPGLGLLLKGSETAYRQAIAGAAFEFLDESEILNLLRGAGTEKTALPFPNDRLFGFIEPRTVTFIEKVLRDTEKQLGIQYTDSGYMALVVHLSLAIRRLQNGERIELDAEELDRLQALPEYDVAQQIAASIGERFQLSIPAAEAGFITMHLCSARIWGHNSSGQLQAVNTRQLVTALVQSVERQVGLPFHTCQRLLDDLTSHMDALVNRLALGQRLDTMQNAVQTEMLRQNYPEIYNAIEQSKGLLKSRLGAESFPPSEITFIAMHFAAAAELLRAKQRRVSAAVVCPSGMGASRMLAANLTRSCPDVDVRQVASALRITPDSLRRDGIDLVISTVPLQIDFPFVCVQAIPQAQDMLKITQAIEALSHRRKEQHEQPLKTETPRMTRSRMESLVRLGTEITQILDHFTLYEPPPISHSEDLIGCAAGLFADGIASRQIIGADLARRETVQSTFLPEMRIYLLHCVTRAVQHCRFGYLRLLQPLVIPEGKVEGAVLMLAPKSDFTEGKDVISHVSILLAENNAFLSALKRGDGKEGKTLAETALLQYYESELRRKTGG